MKCSYGVLSSYIARVMASNGVTIFSATKTDERIEKDMITEQSEKAGLVLGDAEYINRK